MAFTLLWLTVFIMFFQPTIVFPWLEPYSPLKNTALLALVAYVFSGPKNKSTVSFWDNKTNRYFVFFVLMQFLSASHVWIVAGIENINFWLRYGIVYFLIIKSSTSLFRIRMITLSIILAIGYLVYFSLLHFVVDFEPGMRAAGFGWYENSNDLAVIIISVIPLAYMLFETERNAILKLLFLCITCSFAFNILFTGSRNGLLGLCTVGALSLIFSRKSKKVRVTLAVLLAFAIVGIGLANVLLRQDLSGLSGDDSSENRIEQWHAAARMVKAHPFLGVGPFEAAGEMRNYGGIRGLAIHNTIIQAFAETGIPGGILFVLFSLGPLFHFFRNFKSYISCKDMTMVYYKYCCIALAGFWVCAIFGNRIMGYQLYVLVALITAATNLMQVNEPEALPTIV